LKRPVFLLPLFVCPVFVCLAGCGGGPSAQTASEAPAPPPEAHVDPATAGTVSGRVLFTGKAPAMPVIDMSSNPQCERQHKTAVKAETVVVNSNGTLKNVFVHIKDGLAVAHWPVPPASARLEQDGCIYEPHVQGMMQGQNLEILNNDPVNHNVHAECEKNAAWNVSQPSRAEHRNAKFDLEETLFPVTCSVHPWMRAYIGVSSHPFFAVTGADGAFTLNGVPPGTYTIEAVHEKFGSKQGKLTLAPKGTATIEFTYGS
jgi:plastocyanin